jgi:hypothetical protein
LEVSCNNEFLSGSIGKLKDGSGIVEVFQACYGSVTVGQTLAGKAKDRAVTGHKLMQSVLYVLLLRDLLNISCPEHISPSGALEFLFILLIL